MLQKNISIIACLFGTTILVGLGFYFCNNKRISPQKSYALGFTSLEAIDKPAHLSIIGSLPSWLSGSLFLLGPAHFEKSEKTHYLDGHAMIHKFSLSPHSITYMHKFLKTNFRKEQATKDTKAIYDNPLFGLSSTGDALIALSPQSTPHMINPKTINTLPKPLFADLSMPFNFNTRECYDPHEKMYYGIRLDWKENGGYYLYKRAPYSPMRTFIAAITSNKTSFITSFSITENTLVVVAHPLTIDRQKAQKVGMPQLNHLAWHPQKGSRIYVVEKETGRQVGRYEAPTFFSMHHINAFEVGNELNIDLITHRNPKFLSYLYLDRLHSKEPYEGSSSYAQRISINRDTGQLNMRNLSSNPVEMPTINQSYTCQPYQYFYALHGKTFNELYNTLVKVSLNSDEIISWHEDGCYPGQPIFIANPQAQLEDDGVILSIVLDSKHKRSFLLALDAQTMQEIARANLTHHIPIGLCGIFLAV